MFREICSKNLVAGGLYSALRRVKNDFWLRCFVISVVTTLTAFLCFPVSLLTVWTGYKDFFVETTSPDLVVVTLSVRNLRQWPTSYTLALFYNTFIIILYMFGALYAHHQEVELYWCSIWYWCTTSEWSRPLTCFQSEDTRCCINPIQPHDDENIMLETCRWL